MVDIKTEIISRVVPAKSRSKNYVQYSGASRSSGSSVVGGSECFLQKLTDANGTEYLFAKYPLVTEGSLTQYGTPNPIVDNLFDGIKVDGTTIIKRPDGTLVAVGGGGGTSNVSIKLNDKIFKPNSDGQIDLPKYATHLSQLQNDTNYITNVALNGLASESWVRQNCALKTHNHLWSDINNTPITLGGYGITDAVTLNTNQSITGLKEFNNHFAYMNRMHAGWLNCIIKESYTSGWALGMNFINKGETLGRISGHGGNGYMSFIQFRIGDVNHELREGYLDIKGYITADEFKGNTDWRTVLNKPTTLEGYGITDAVTLSTTQLISGFKIFQDKTRIHNTAEPTLEFKRGNNGDFGSSGWGDWKITNDNYLRFIRGLSGNEKEIFTLYGGGDYGIGSVGINNPTPKETLDVNGNVKAKDFITNDKIFRYDSSIGAFTLNAPLVVEGGIVMNAILDELKIPTIQDAIRVDGITIVKRTDGTLHVPNSSGGTLSEVTINLGSTAYKSVDGVVSLPAYSSHLSELENDVGYITNIALNGLASESWVGQNYALKTHKHNWSDISYIPIRVWGQPFDAVKDVSGNLELLFSQITSDGGSILGANYLGNTILSTSKSGAKLYLRPNGRSSSIGEVIIDNLGNSSFRGPVTSPRFIGQMQWDNLINTPTTLGSYGITDAVTLYTQQDITAPKTFRHIQVHDTVILPKVNSFGHIVKGTGDGATKEVYNTKMRLHNGFAISNHLDEVTMVLDARKGTIEANRFIGLADSTTKLNDYREFWGNRFNGEQNVDGDIVTEKGFHELKLGRIGFNQVDWIEHGGLWRFMGSAGQTYLEIDKGNIKAKDFITSGSIYGVNGIQFNSNLNITDGFGENILKTFDYKGGTALSMMEESMILNSEGAAINGKVMNIDKIVFKGGGEMWYDEGLKAFVIDEKLLVNGGVTMNTDKYA